MASSSASASRVRVRKGRKSRGPQPSQEEIEAGLLIVNQWDPKKVKLMKKPLLVEICRRKFGGDTEVYDELTMENMIAQLVR